MSRAIVSAIIAAMGLSVVGSSSERENAVDLNQYTWKNRLLFVFAPTREEPSFEAIHDSLMEQQEAVVDRDLVVFELLESESSTRDGESLDPASARQLRERFGVPAGEFSVVLVGKDGGVKLDRQDPISLDEIFSLIDSMPMRQHEMRRKNS